MDGYAIRHAELPGPWCVTGESAAGASLPQPLAPGSALRIFTGAPMPPGADCVLVQEEAARTGDTLSLAGEGPAHPGRNVRGRGSDFLADDPLITAGERLTPARLALAAVAGHGALAVRGRARVALLSTGDELLPPGVPVPPGRLPSSNATMLAALFGALGCAVTDLGIARDDLDALAAAIGKAGDADLLITTGGASVGDHDLVRPALLAAGASIDFWKVALRPGKPLMAGRRGDQIILGLPGNPVSALVTARLFAVPLVRAMMGDAAPVDPFRRANLVVPIGAGGDRDEYLRGIEEGGGVRAITGQDSGALRALAGATLLIRRPAHAPPAATGDLVDTLDIA
jgi:molybdopterin molybdotransferase